jgi:uncharacterized protein (TIGR03067 family)
MKKTPGPRLQIPKTFRFPTLKDWRLGALALSAALLASAPCSRGAGAEAGFQPMFNGKDLTGWDGNSKLWFAKNGVIVGQTTLENPLKGNTFLVWTNEFPGDFELRCAFRITPNNNQGFANSGIQYRSRILDPANWVVGGYQADMEAGPTYTGILYEERMTRGIMASRGEKVIWDKDCLKRVVGSLGKPDELLAAIKQGDWNEYVIIVKGFHFQHFINGKQTVDVTDDCEAKRATNGVLALQLHAGPSMTVEFRDLRIKTGSGGSASAGDEINRLQGTWQVVGIEADGTAVPSEYITNIVAVIAGSNYRVINNDKVDRGVLTIVPSETPRQMDIRPTLGDNAGRTMPGIYELGPDSLKVCFAQEGTKRPASFSTADDASFLLMTYKRKRE